MHIGSTRISTVFLAAAESVHRVDASRDIVLALLRREKQRGVWLDMSKEGPGGLAARTLLMKRTGHAAFDSAVSAYRNERVPYLEDTVYLSEATDSVRTSLLCWL